MLEKLLQGFRKNLIGLSLAGGLLLGVGCSTYKTMPSDLIKPVVSIERQVDDLIKNRVKNPIYYDRLTYKEVIDYVQTPEQAKDYLDIYLSNKKVNLLDEIFYKVQSFKYIHSEKEGLCLDYAVSAAALLSDNGYPPLLLGMIGGQGLIGNQKHMVFIYRNKEGFGALGNTSLKSGYSSVSELIKGFKTEYGWKFDKYGIINLDDNFPDKSWIDGDINLHLKFLDKVRKVE